MPCHGQGRQPSPSWTLLIQGEEISCSVTCSVTCSAPPAHCGPWVHHLFHPWGRTPFRGPRYDPSRASGPRGETQDKLDLYYKTTYRFSSRAGFAEAFSSLSPLLQPSLPPDRISSRPKSILFLRGFTCSLDPTGIGPLTPVSSLGGSRSGI